MIPVDPVNIQEAILSRYGTVRRANGYHLYTAKGKRLLDLYREAGAAILGWKSGKAKLVFKSLLDRGLTGSFPTEKDGELVRAVQELLPQYPEVRWYASRERAARACAAFLDLWSEIPLMESPLLHPEAAEDIGPGGDSPLSAARNLHGIEIWRPWLDDAFYAMSDRVDSSFLRGVNESLDTMVLASPLPFAGGVTVLVSRLALTNPLRSVRSGISRTARRACPFFPLSFRRDFYLYGTGLEGIRPLCESLVGSPWSLPRPQNAPVPLRRVLQLLSRQRHPDIP